MKKSILFVCLLSFSCFASISNTNKSSIDSRLITLEINAQAGNSKAQFFLSQIYLQGATGIKKDITKGISWLKKAAETSQRPEIQEYLGEIFHYGYYGETSFKQAIYWYLKSAENGYASAMDYVGLFYSGGLGGLPQSCAKAIEWFEKAFEGGFLQAQGNIVWSLATCPNKAHRDGKKALQLALTVIKNKGKEQAGDLDNLAAAYAENGDFSQAIQIQKKAISLLNPQAEPIRLSTFNERLHLYKTGLTWQGASNASPADYNQ